MANRDPYDAAYATISDFSYTLPSWGEEKHNKKIAKLPKVIRRNGQVIYLR